MIQFSITRQRKIWWILSATLSLLSIVCMAISWAGPLKAPLRPGLDFVGGTSLQVERDCKDPSKCAEPIDAGKVRQILAEQNLSNGSVQVSGPKGQGLVLKTPSLSAEARAKLQDSLNSAIGPFDPTKTQIDTVGPTLGRQILSSGLLALALSFLGITTYLTFRFQLDYAILSIVALFHDVLITTGAFSLLGLVAGVEVDSLFVVALLTITGFSVNDTVVIYDRIRETRQQNEEQNLGKSVDQIVDDAVNQTMGRSINTTLTVLFTLFSIFIFGGATLKNFALALIIGFTLGAYSSIFIASSLIGWWQGRQPQVKPIVEVTD
jgi:preprotein translocase subunit SecF